MKLYSGKSSSNAIDGLFMRVPCSSVFPLKTKPTHAVSAISTTFPPGISTVSVFLIKGKGIVSGNVYLCKCLCVSMSVGVSVHELMSLWMFHSMQGYICIHSFLCLWFPMLNIRIYVSLCGSFLCVCICVCIFVFPAP